MIDMDKWEELMIEWARVVDGPIDKIIYQIPRRVKDRLEHFNEHCLPHLKDKKVVELGCNAGWFGYQIDKVSKSYLGVEPGQLIAKKKSRTDYYKQAQITQKHMSKSAKFLNATVSDFASVETNDFNAIVMCFVLYHLTNTEVDLLIKKILPKCDTVVIQNRSQKRPTAHNEYKFWKANNVMKLLVQSGFNCEIIWGPGDKYSEIIGKKPAKMPKPVITTNVKETVAIPQETVESGNKVIEDLKKAAIVPKKDAVVPKKAPIKKSVKKSIKKAPIQKKEENEDNGQS